jgi:hypothetical protein
MGNLLGLAFDRGLSRLDDLLPVEEIVPRPQFGAELMSPHVGHVRASRLRASFGVSEWEDEDAGDLIRLVARGAVVRVHNAIKKYSQDMLREGVLEVREIGVG